MVLLILNQQSHDFVTRVGSVFLGFGEGVVLFQSIFNNAFEYIFYTMSNDWVLSNYDFSGVWKRKFMVYLKYSRCDCDEVLRKRK
jgi:hypothetical protein